MITNAHRPTISRVWRAALALLIVLLPAVLVSGALAVLNTRAGPAAGPAAEGAGRVLREQLDAAGVPGGAVVVVTADGRVDAFGVGSAGDSRPVTSDTPFVIGSTTKSFTALAVMQLVDSGNVDLDAAVRDYVPEFRLAEGEPVGEITVRHVLQQTSGLSDAAGGPVLASATGGTALDAIAEVDGAELVAAPGKAWLYANVNYVLAGLVVERASGMPYPDYVQRRILDPLGMTRSFTTLDAARAAGLARGHRFWFGVPVESGPNHRDGMLAAGYLISTAQDLGRYLAMYLAGGVSEDGTRVVSSRGLQTMLTAGPEATLGPWADGQASRYAMGWLVAGPWAQPGLVHPGNSPDSSAMITLFPGRGLAVAVLVAAGHELPVPGNPAITDRISRTVVHAALGEPVPDGPSLRTFYFVFDLVALVMVAAAAYGLVRSLTAVRRRQRSSRPALRWSGIALRTVAAGLVLVVPSLSYGWATAWTWAPDLGLVLAALAVLWAATAAIRLASLLGAWHATRPGDTEPADPADALRERNEPVLHTATHVP